MRSRLCLTIADREKFIRYITGRGATNIRVGADAQTVWWSDPVEQVTEWWSNSMEQVIENADHGYSADEEYRHPTTGQTVNEVAREFTRACQRLSAARSAAEQASRYGSTPEMRAFYTAVAASLSMDGDAPPTSLEERNDA